MENLSSFFFFKTQFKIEFLLLFMVCRKVLRKMPALIYEKVKFL